MNYQATPSSVSKRRRRHSRQFKDQVLAECRVPGASVAGVALRHGLNLNLVHTWRRTPNADAQDAFLRLPSPAPTATQLALGDSAGVQAQVNTIRIDVPVACGHITLHWPLSQLDRSVDWLKALMQ